MELKKWIALGIIPAVNTRSIFEKTQYLYDHVLCLRMLIEDSMQQFSDEYNRVLCLKMSIEKSIKNVNSKSYDENIKITNTIDDENELRQMTGFILGKENDEKENDSQEDNIRYEINWCNIQIGDEFSQICIEGIDSLSNATRHIVFGQLVDFSIENENQNQNERIHEINVEGWNIYNILKSDDANQKKILLICLVLIFHLGGKLLLCIYF
ncbi:hypothetical protein RFI_07512 [Reticulomyxa filosa]|uniref:Uncharacterized protein n=1 Tax=Reticulomyxa filosa TaxID=46433 RepID=X6NUY3_RETFI|nr:hypothetical protein RFI_07512 [Reticulomyxa filosa]|eukprot:ETO29609.1 hypothetical protein RFI_07512 [Reticulomyxa filosa]